VVAWGDSPDLVPVGGLLRSSDAAAVAGRVAAELAEAIAGLEIAGIVAGRTRLRAAAAFGEEVERVTTGLYTVMRSKRTAIMVLDRCAGEIPALAGVWFGEGRYAVVDLWHAYLVQRSKYLTIAVDPTVLARTIVELVTTWAVKMPWDPAPRPYTDDTAAACAAMTRHLLVGRAV
jgi:glutathione S-transferase